MKAAQPTALDTDTWDPWTHLHPRERPETCFTCSQEGDAPRYKLTSPIDTPNNCHHQSHPAQSQHWHTRSSTATADAAAADPTSTITVECRPSTNIQITAQCDISLPYCCWAYNLSDMFIIPITSAAQPWSQQYVGIKCTTLF